MVKTSLLQTLDSRRVLVGTVGAVGTPGTKGAGILHAQDTCPIMNQHPVSLALDHDRARVLGIFIAKHISNPDVACRPF